MPAPNAGELKDSPQRPPAALATPEPSSHKRAMRRAVLAVFAALVAGVVFYAMRPAATTPLPIVIERLKTPQSGLLLIAEAKGFFAEEGLNATVRTNLTGYEGITSVLQGKADVAVAAETPIARALSEGKQPRVIATIFSSQWNSGIVARKDRGVNNPGDLKGKRIGYVPGTATHYMLETFLAFHGIPLDSVTLVKHRPDQIVAALTSGDLDAASIWTPYLTRMQEQLGDRGQTFLPRDFYSEMTNLVVGPDFVKSNRETVDRLLRALIKAETFATAHREEAINLMASASGMNVNALRGHGDPMTYELTLKQALLLATENEVRWHFRRGLVTNDHRPDVLRAFETEPLRALKTSSVTIAK